MSGYNLLDVCKSYQINVTFLSTNVLILFVTSHAQLNAYIFVNLLKYPCVFVILQEAFIAKVKDYVQRYAKR